MKFPLTVSQFAEWAEKNRRKRFKISGSRSNSCPLATCLKKKHLATADVIVGDATFALTYIQNEWHPMPHWAARFVKMFDSEETQSFTGAQILRIIKDENLCKLEKEQL